MVKTNILGKVFCIQFSFSLILNAKMSCTFQTKFRNSGHSHSQSEPLKMFLTERRQKRKIFQRDLAG